jgi:hypothetical protein
MPHDCVQFSIRLRPRLSARLVSQMPPRIITMPGNVEQVQPFAEECNAQAGSRTPASGA